MIDCTKKISASPSAKIIEVIDIIDRGSYQVALIVDELDRLIGTVTDGDIRRALLRGETLEAAIGGVMQRSFKCLPESATDSDAMALMIREDLQQVPAVDECGRVVRLFILDELIKAKNVSNTVVIMAGGEGKRLYPLTQDCPKPMLRVNDKPILEIILEQCINGGFSHFYFSVNYLKEQIREYFGDGARWRVHIDYLEENKPLGTAGALSLLPPQTKEPVLVLNGDVLTRVDYKNLLRFHAEHSAGATVCVREHTTEIPYGVIHVKDLHILKIEEKPRLLNYVNCGIYLINPELFNLIPQNSFFDMPDLIDLALSKRYPIVAFPIHEYWLDVGYPSTLQQASGEWK